jgi:hypothetical protein
MAHNYDPAKTPCPPLYDHPHPCEICGPGGTTTRIENNEKGILETHLAMSMQGHKQASLRSNHDSFKQGIYTTNSVGDND